MRRQLTTTEKQTVKDQQLLEDGSLRCFISGEIILDGDDIEYDHIHPVSKDGETDVENIRIVLKKHNRRKSNQSLYDVRDNIKLEKLFEQRKNNIKLQDIFELKDIQRRNTHANSNGDTITIDDGNDVRTFQLLHDDILNVDYFYSRIPVYWLENDDQEGLQPRVIDYKRLISIRDHLKEHPQLAPSIGRLVGTQLKLFDGQHKLAGQVLNNTKEVDVKIYISPDNQEQAKKLFDGLMITNLEAHSKLKQVPFYTSTLLDRLSVIYKELLDEFISGKPIDSHTEYNFINFLIVEKQFGRAEAKEMLRSAIKNSTLDNSTLSKYVAVASKDPNYPLTIDFLNKTLFPVTLYLEPSTAKFTSEEDYRNAEVDNFSELAQIIVEESHLPDWVLNVKGKTLTNIELKARRIWHKGSVLIWSGYMKSILYFAFQVRTTEEREKILYRPALTDKEKVVIRECLNRLFNHNMWDEPDGEVDILLASSKKQDELFNRKGLSEKYVIYGTN